jgi:hypothetical protein
MIIKGFYFPTQTKEEEEFILEETANKSAVECMKICVHWLEAVEKSDPTDDDDAEEGDNGA